MDRRNDRKMDGSRRKKVGTVRLLGSSNHGSVFPCFISAVFIYQWPLSAIMTVSEQVRCQILHPSTKVPYVGGSDCARSLASFSKS